MTLEAKVTWLQKENDALIESNRQLLELVAKHESYQRELEAACKVGLDLKLACTKILNRVEQDENVEQWVLDDLRTALSLGE